MIRTVLDERKNNNIIMALKIKIVFSPEPGMSRENGLPLFRGEGDVWNEIDYEKVVTLK